MKSSKTRSWCECVDRAFQRFMTPEIMKLKKSNIMYREALNHFISYQQDCQEEHGIYGQRK